MRNVRFNRPYSYSRYLIGTSLQERLLQVIFSNANYIFYDNLDCSQSSIFPWDRRCRSLSPTGRHLSLLTRAKLGRVQNSCLTPSPLPTGILYSPQFCSHQETKMAVRRTQRSTSTISRENRGLSNVIPSHEPPLQASSSPLPRIRIWPIEIQITLTSIFSCGAILRAWVSISSSLLFSEYYHTMRYFWLLFFSPILLERSAEIILSVLSCKPFHRATFLTRATSSVWTLHVRNSEGNNLLYAKYKWTTNCQRITQGGI